MTTANKHLMWAAITAATTACSGCNNPPPPPAAPPPPMPMPSMAAPVPPQPLPCDQAQTLSTTTAMQARAAAEAPGMKPEGAPICGVVAEGQTFVGPTITLEQGYCYTFIGQSLPPVVQMEMVLQGDASALVAPLMPSMANAAQAPLLVSTVPGERVNMGEKQSCYRWAFPVPATAKLMLKARAGGGPVAAQIYKKKAF
ncbi:MAG: hypothetical protein QM820_17340 [Minicystis sp.]